MKYALASKHQAAFLNIYVFLFIIILFSPKLMNTTSSFYPIVTHWGTFIMTAMAIYLLFVSAIVWRKNPTKRTIWTSLAAIGQIIILIGSVGFLYYKFF
jgi:hypothetical protein